MVIMLDVWGCHQSITEKGFLGPAVVSLRCESTTTAKNSPKSLSTWIFCSLWVEASPGGLKGSEVGTLENSNEVNWADFYLTSPLPRIKENDQLYVLFWDVSFDPKQSFSLPFNLLKKTHILFWVTSQQKVLPVKLQISWKASCLYGCIGVTWPLGVVRMTEILQFLVALSVADGA